MMFVQKKKSSLRKEQTELQAKMKKCEQALSSCLSCIDEKKKKTENLKKNIKDQKIKCNQLQDMTNAYVKYSGQFSEFALRDLRSISMKNCSDSTFVLHALRYTYANNPEDVKQKSVTAKSALKQPITPDKLSTLKGLYSERMNNITRKDEVEARSKKFNVHVKNGLRSCSKVFAPKEIDEFVEILVSNTDNDILVCGKKFKKNITIGRLKVVSSFVGFFI